MFPQDVPFILGYAVACFAAVNGSKLERTVNVCVEMGNVEPFLIGQEVVVLGVVIRRVGRSNEVRVGREGGMSDILATVELEPVTLVNRIVTPICWMANVELK
jgi:hypothetical protein